MIPFFTKRLISLHAGHKKCMMQRSLGENNDGTGKLDHVWVIIRFYVSRYWN